MDAPASKILCIQSQTLIQNILWMAVDVESQYVTTLTSYKYRLMYTLPVTMYVYLTRISAIRKTCDERYLSKLWQKIELFVFRSSRCYTKAIIEHEKAIQA